MGNRTLEAPYLASDDGARLIIAARLEKSQGKPRITVEAVVAYLGRELEQSRLKPTNVRQKFDRLRNPSHPEVRPGAFALITRGGDDGTRTHDPLLANTPDLDDDEQ
jgi:hypothetical protein